MPMLLRYISIHPIKLLARSYWLLNAQVLKASQKTKNSKRVWTIPQDGKKGKLWDIIQLKSTVVARPSGINTFLHRAERKNRLLSFQQKNSKNWFISNIQSAIILKNTFLIRALSFISLSGGAIVQTGIICAKIFIWRFILHLGEKKKNN